MWVFDWSVSRSTVDPLSAISGYRHFGSELLPVRFGDWRLVTGECCQLCPMYCNAENADEMILLMLIGIRKKCQSVF